jgi:phosphoribosylformylglycinamidine synthase
VRLASRPCRARFVKPGEFWDAPVAHGEGQLVAKDRAALDRLVADGLVAFAYVNPDGSSPAAYPANPNGSALDIAGICDVTGRVLGLMPHPERNVEFFHHPEWTRRTAREPGAGLDLVKALVAEARAAG